MQIGNWKSLGARKFLDKIFVYVFDQFNQNTVNPKLAFSIRVTFMICIIAWQDQVKLIIPSFYWLL